MTNFSSAEWRMIALGLEFYHPVVFSKKEAKPQKQGIIRKNLQLNQDQAIHPFEMFDIECGQG